MCKCLTTSKSGGPSPKEQLLAITESRYWIVLNSSLLKNCGSDKSLLNRANALKHALQTYGPTSTSLPDFRYNKGKANSYIFHGHAINSNGCTYILEWTVIDAEKRVIALIGFDTHENYSFRQKPLSEDERKKILLRDENKQIMARATKKIAEAKERTTRNYRNAMQ